MNRHHLKWNQLTVINRVKAGLTGFVVASSILMAAMASPAKADANCISVPSGDVVCMGNDALGQNLTSTTVTMPWGDKATKGSLKGSYVIDCINTDCN